MVTMLLTLVTFVKQPEYTAYADANDRVRGLIDVYNGKYEDVGTMGMSGKELQVYGVFLSNFYEPFTTRIDVGEGDGEQTETETTRSELKSILTEVASIDADYAEKIIGKVMEGSKTSAANNGLRLGTKKGSAVQGSGGIEPLKHGRGSKNVSYFEFSRLVIGATQLEEANVNGYKLAEPSDTEIERIKANIATDYTKAMSETEMMVLYYLDTAGQPVEAFSFIPNINAYKAKLTDDEFKRIIPASQQMFMQILAGKSSTGSLAASMHDIHEDEYSTITKDSAIEKVLKPDGGDATQTDFNKLANTSQWAWEMFIDSFGNIILDTKRHQYIMLPAAMNPYIYKEYKGDNSARNLYPVNNLQSMSAANAKEFFTFEGISNAIPTISTNLDILAEQSGSHVFRKDADGGERLDIPRNYLKLYPNSDITTYNGKKTFFGNTTVSEVYYTYLTLLAGTQHFGLDTSAASQYYEKGSRGYKVPKEVFAGQIKKIGKKTVEDAYAAAIAGTKNSSTDDKKMELVSYGTQATSTAYKNIAQTPVYPYINMLAVGGQDEVYSYGTSKLTNQTGKKAITQLAVFSNLGIIPEGMDPNTVMNTFGFTTPYTAGGALVTSYQAAVAAGGSTYGKVPFTADGVGINKDISKALAGNIYLTYLLAGSDIEKYNTEMGWQLDFTQVPSISEIIGTNDTAFQALTDEQLAKLQTWAYLALDPTSEAGAMYATASLNNKITHMLLSVNEQIGGASDSKISTGAAGFNTSSVSTFMTIPVMSEIPFFNKVLDSYYSVAIYLMVAFVIIQLISIIFKTKSLQMAFLSIGIFFASIATPPILLESTSAITNQMSSKVYSNKFVYWSILQHQGYINDLNVLARGGSIASSYLENESNRNDGILATGDNLSMQSNYFQNLMLLQNQANPNFAASPVTIKWLSPKKDNYLNAIEQEFGGREEFQGALGSLKGLLKGSVSNELYDPDSNGLYLYRTILDINNYSRFIYGNTGADILYDNEETGTTKHNYGSLSSSLALIGMSDVYSGYITGTGDTSLRKRISNGFIPDLKNTTIAGGDAMKRLYLPLSSSPISQASKNDISNKKRLDTWGLGQAAYNITPKNFNIHTKSLRDQISGGTMSEDLAGGDTRVIMSNEDYASTAANALYTESPYYYFNWMLYDNGLDIKPKEDTSVDNESIKKFLLSKDNEFFYNYKMGANEVGYGELKDFLDMGSLFHAVIPYLKEANKPLIAYTDQFGTKHYPGIDGSELAKGKYASDTTSDAYYKHMHNSNLLRLYGPYSAWVDLIYSTDLAKPEEIRYAGERQRVEDPVNPASYELRPMVFSESEMKFYGLNDSDLTKVERAIIKTNRDIYNDYLQLVNYVNFDPAVVGNAMALIATFNFNQNFSQEGGMFKETYTLYPQTFELKNFSYDAYNRLVLQAASGIDLIGPGSGNIYLQIMNTSGWWIGIPLIINTFMAEMAIPVARIVVMAMLAIMLVMIFMTAALNIGNAGDGESTNKWTKIFKPILIFIVLNLGFTLVFSFFMSNGLTSATGDMIPVLSLGSPGTTLFTMMLIFGLMTAGHVYIIVDLWKTLRHSIWSDLKLGFNHATNVFREATGNARAYVNGRFGNGAGPGRTGATGTTSGNVAPSIVDPVDYIEDAITQPVEADRDSYNEALHKSKTKEFDELIRKGQEQMDKRGNALEDARPEDYSDSLFDEDLDTGD